MGDIREKDIYLYRPVHAPRYATTFDIYMDASIKFLLLIFFENALVGWPTRWMVKPEDDVPPLPPPSGTSILDTPCIYIYRAYK